MSTLVRLAGLEEYSSELLGVDIDIVHHSWKRSINPSPAKTRCFNKSQSEHKDHLELCSSTREMGRMYEHVIELPGPVVALSGHEVKSNLKFSDSSDVSGSYRPAPFRTLPSPSSK